MEWTRWSATAALLLMATQGLGGQERMAISAAGGALRRAEMSVDLAGFDATAGVRVHYRLWVPPGVTEVPITLLTPRPVAVVDLVARTPTRIVEVDLPSSGTAQRRGLVRFPGGPPAGALSLIFEYRVERSVRPAGAAIDAVVPVLAVDWPPAEPLPGTFRARLTVPGNVAVYESFPTTLTGPRSFGGRGLWDVELSVLPAYVRVRGRVGEPPLLSLGRVVDGGVLALLLVLGMVGWRRLRETA